MTPVIVRRRLSELCDPAIVRPELRVPGADAYGPRLHVCGAEATWFTDPYALGACFARCVEHPRVRQRLDRAFDPASVPSPTRVPLSWALGPDGHRYVDGFRLDPIDGDLDRARQDRDAWVRQAMRDPSGAGSPPSVVRIPSFVDGWVRFAFRPDFERCRYETSTMYAVPPRPPAA